MDGFEIDGSSHQLYITSMKNSVKFEPLPPNISLMYEQLKNSLPLALR